MRAQGGRGKHIQICLCLAQSIMRVTTELGRRHRVSSYHQTRRGSASVAVRTEKWTTPKNHKCYNTNVHFVVWNGEAKPKISFPFLFPLRGGGVGGGGARKMQGNFLVFAHASTRACPRRASLVVRVQFKIHSNFVQYTPPLLVY